MQEKRKTKDVRKYGKVPRYSEEEQELIEWMATPAGEAWLEELLKFE
jgi:DnaJ-domain-containing protein 1